MNQVKTREKEYLTGKNKRTSNFDQRRKGFKPNKSFRNNSQNFPKNNYQVTYFKGKTQQNITAPKGRDMPNNYVKNNEHKEPVKCWECQGPHHSKYCRNIKGNFSNVHTIQEEETVVDVENEMPRINAALENQQTDHQTSMVEVQGMIQNQSISFLIDPGPQFKLCVTQHSGKMQIIFEKV